MKKMMAPPGNIADVRAMLDAAGGDTGGADIGELALLLALLREHQRAMEGRGEYQRDRTARLAEAARQAGRKPPRAGRDPWQRLEAARAQMQAALREIEVQTREAAAECGKAADAIDAAMKAEIGPVREGLRAAGELLAPRRPRPLGWAEDAAVIFAALCGLTGSTKISREGPAARFVADAVAWIGWPRPAMARVDQAIRRRLTATKSS